MKQHKGWTWQLFQHLCPGKTHLAIFWNPVEKGCLKTRQNIRGSPELTCTQVVVWKTILSLLLLFLLKPCSVWSSRRDKKAMAFTCQYHSHERVCICHREKSRGHTGHRRSSLTENSHGTLRSDWSLYQLRDQNHRKATEETANTTELHRFL